MNTIERRIVRQVIADLIDGGYAVSVDDGGGSESGYLIRKSRDAAAILAQLGTMGEDVLHVAHPTASPASSFVHLVYNGDETVVCDHGESLTEVLARSSALADKLAG